jgi:hypothetical protein
MNRNTTKDKDKKNVMSLVDGHTEKKIIKLQQKN